MGQRHFGVAPETVYGTPVAPTDFSNLISEDFAFQREKEDVDLLDKWELEDFAELTQAIRGSVELWGNYNTPGVLLKHLYGDVLTSGAGPFSHTYPPAGGIPAAGRDGVSLAAEVRKNNSLSFRFGGLKTVGFGIESAVDKTARFNVDFVGKNVATATPPATETLPAWAGIKHKDLTLQIDAAAIDCVSLEVNVEFPVDEPYDSEGGLVFGREPADNGAFLVSGSIEAFFTSTTEYDKMVSFADIDISAAYTNGTESLTLNMNKAKLIQGEAPVNQRDRLLATFEFEAHFDTTATSSMQLILVNQDATIP